MSCVPPLDQLAKKGAYQFQKNILKILHNHSISSILFYLISNQHHVHLRSFAKLKASAWQSGHLVILFFPFNFICFLLRNVHQIGLFPSLAIGLSHPTCGQPLDPMGIHLFCYAHGKEKIHHMMSCKMAFHPSQKMQVFMLHINRPTFFYHLTSSPHVNRSTLCF